MKDTDLQQKSPFMFKLGRSFTNQLEVLKYLTDASDQNSISSQYSGDYNTKMSAYLDSVSESGGQILTRPKQASTALGMNDAINCYYGFCEDDDIVHPNLTIPGDPPDGMGRAYSETFDTNQQLLHMTVGVAEYCGVTQFYTTAFNKDLAKAVNDGYTSSWAHLIGTVIGGSVRLAFFVATWPLQFMGFAIKTINTMTSKVTKYYEFRDAMPMYYRFVDSILVHLAVNLGFYPNSSVLPDAAENSTGGITNGEQFSQNYSTLMWNDDLTESSDKSGLPLAFEDGISIFNVLQRRDRKLNARNGGSYTTIPSNYEDYMSKNNADNKEGYFSQFTPRLVSTIQGADKFVSFKIEKSTDSNESVSNATGESSISQMINSKISAARSLNFTFMDGKLAGSGVTGDVINTAITGVKSLIGGAIDAIDMTNLADAFLNGSGFLDFPEVWQSSSFAKSYNFNMVYRSPYGDPTSIFYSCYVPLAFWLAASLPRSTGKNSYTAPFSVKMYSKGMFAIPNGIIDSLSIRRGSSEFGWNRGALPTVIEVSMTVKDLSPIMHIAIAGGGEFLTEAFGQNSSFQEYMLTLSGIGLNERLLWSNNLARRVRTAMELRKNTWFSPIAYWPHALADTSVGRLVSALTPWSRFSNK